MLFRLVRDFALSRFFPCPMAGRATGLHQKDSAFSQIISRLPFDHINAARFFAASSSRNNYFSLAVDVRQTASLAPRKFSQISELHQASYALLAREKHCYKDDTNSVPTRTFRTCFT